MLATMAMVGNNQILCLMVMAESCRSLVSRLMTLVTVQLQRLMVTLKV
jgi:hypothetical protein